MSRKALIVFVVIAVVVGLFFFSDYIFPMQGVKGIGVEILRSDGTVEKLYDDVPSDPLAVYFYTRFGKVEMYPGDVLRFYPTWRLSQIKGKVSSWTLELSMQHRFDGGLWNPKGQVRNNPWVLNECGYDPLPQCVSYGYNDAGQVYEAYTYNFFAGKSVGQHEIEIVADVRIEVTFEDGNVVQKSGTAQGYINYEVTSEGTLGELEVNFAWGGF